MAEFSIVHLSDLHIEGSVLSPSLEKLIESVKKQTEKLKSVILVITGDIIHQGKYKENANKSSNNVNKVAFDFFVKLEKAMNGDESLPEPWKHRRVIDVQIVAGNHDKFLEFGPGNNIYNEFMGNESDWKAAEELFNDFKNLVNVVYSIFKLKPGIRRKKIRGYWNCEFLSDEDKAMEWTSGVEFIEIPCLTEVTELSLGKPDDCDLNSCCNRCRKIHAKDATPELTICFIRLNTAITSFGGKEEEELHNLTLSNYQLQMLKRDYKHFRDEHKNHDLLTFVLAHHPTTFLKPTEEDSFRETLLNEDGMQAQYYLCGHTHTRSLTNLSNNISKVTTLVTGIGWPDKEGEKRPHAYSIYTFSEEKSNMTSRMYISDDYGEFMPDNSFYHGKQRKEGMISLPFRVAEFPAITLSRSGLEMNELHIDESVLRNLKNLFTQNRNFIHIMDNCLRNTVLKSLRQYYEEERRPISFHEDIQKIILEHESIDPNDMDIKISNDLFTPKIDKLIKEIIKIIGKDGKDKDGKDHISQMFHYFLNQMGLYFRKQFGDLFVGDIVRFRICHHNYNGNQADCYTPFLQYPTPELPNGSGTKIRTYSWNKDDGKAITGSAYSNHTSKIYTMNKDLVEFQVEHWQDFIVMVPHTLEFTPQPNSFNHSIYPLLSFVFSVRLDEEKIGNFKMLKEMFKAMSNKLYLMEYIGMDKVLDEVLFKFTRFYDVKPENFLEHINHSKE
jgi:3',5'-cyclic AMP phosphodiesterase CpdA